MLDWTDRHCRFFLRLISRRVLLYTEMVTTGAVLHGHRDRLLGFNLAEKPLALQLGGSDPDELAECARIGEGWGYDEINLNVGCPSDRVQRGRFGACLMAEPELVAECVAAMASAVRIPVTVKTRIGIDERDSYEELAHFISAVSAAGCETFIIHARKAWLSGLSPRENREVPPLRYDIAAQIKRDFPRQGIILNGGIQSLDQAKVHLETFDGVMIGRAAYHNPYLLADADRLLFGEADSPLPRRAVVESMLPYIQGELDRGVRLHSMSRHLLGLYHGQPGGRLWRRHLGEAATQRSAGVKELRDVLEQDWLRSA
ncbi:MAG: tRNA dihydrouridine(20/20a) synthase DusA [Methylococcaceae bacterium]|jgi:tRNA-dihydrouridine synthase A|nr:tRNA dihydrouridine(20/20a) synthase DusA [Methylococcaceae bacterium]